MMDKVKFFDQIHKIEIAYRAQPCSEAMLSIYWEALQGFSDQWMENIVNKIIGTEKFFPAVAIFLQYRKYEKRVCPKCKSVDWVSWVDDVCEKCYREEYRNGARK